MGERETEREGRGREEGKRGRERKGERGKG